MREAHGSVAMIRTSCRGYAKLINAAIADRPAA
jgi:hypothetical protein